MYFQNFFIIFIYTTLFQYIKWDISFKATTTTTKNNNSLKKNSNHRKENLFLDF